MNTHPIQAPKPHEPRTYQGRNVLAVQNGRCMHCKSDMTSLLVNLSTGRRWVNTETHGPRNVEHNCSRGAVCSG